jgi:hypothetical protein
LKKAPWAWYAKIDHFFLHIGFKHCEYDHSLNVLHTHDDILIVVVYVDDLVITVSNIDLILRLKKQLVDTFDMSYLGLFHYFLDLQVLSLSHGLFLSQSKYVMDLLHYFKMSGYKSYATPFHFGFKMTKDCLNLKVDATLYRQLVGILIYLTHS